MDKVQLIRQALSALADASIAKQQSAYMRDQFAYFGIKTPTRRAATKAFTSKDRSTTSIDWAFVEACWKQPEREFQYVACDYLLNNRQLVTQTELSKLKKLITTHSWWDTVDALAGVVGALYQRHPEKISAEMLNWSMDKNFWIRRTALTFQLLFKGETNEELLAQIIENNLGQSEFFINKAIGWALRDYSKTNPEWVRKLLSAHQGKLAKLSVTEASKYL